ncbi:MAG: TfoX/Sxy family protein [Rikenellaceae bacterium]|nr:TfoX/Sxy family protein [Rikenellaceae bacterium]
MSSNADFVQYVIDQCSGAGEITVKKMFGEYGLYCDGTFFGVVCDDRLFVKHTEAGAVSVPEAHLRPAYRGAKPSIYFENVDDGESLSALVRVTCNALSRSKTTKRR